MSAHSDPADPAITDDNPAASPSQLELQIRFALADLSARNAAHAFEELCRHFAQARLVSNILPATGPVSSGGDQGRDAETFRSFLADELGPYGGFLGLVSDGPVAFACTLQQEDLPTKVRADVRKITASGTAVVHVYVLCSAALPVAKRHELQSGLKKDYGVDVDIIDGHGLAAHLADAELFWMAVEYLSIPSALAPLRPTAGARPSWYEADLERWRKRGAIRPALLDVLDVQDGLRHATFEIDARPDLPFWLGLMRGAITEGASAEAMRRARYEVAVATIRGLRRLTTADAEVRDFMAGEEDDPAALEDAAILLTYVATAVTHGQTSISPDEVGEWLTSIRTRVGRELAADPPPTRRARLLQVRGQLGLVPDPASLAQPAQPVELPDLSTLDEEGVPRPATVSPLSSARARLADIDDAMQAWAELGRLLPDTPLYPLDGLSGLLRVLAPVLIDHPLWREIVDAVDDGVARTQGAAAAADNARNRAGALLESDRLRDALHELHRAKVGWWSGDTLRGAVSMMLAIARCYQLLNLPLAAKQYALAAMVGAHGAGDDLRDVLSAGLLQAADADYGAGAWCSTLELIDLGLMAHNLLIDDSLDDAARRRSDDAIVHLGMVLRAAKHLVPGALPRAEEIARRHGALEPLLAAIEESTDWDREEFVRIADEQLQGRPFSDLGSERVIRFAAMGLRWRLRAPNDHDHVLALERLAAAAQIVSADIADDDLCLLPTTVDVRVALVDPHSQLDRAELLPSNDGREWNVRLSRLPPGGFLDPQENFQELMSILSVIFLDVSMLPQRRYFEAFARAMERGLWHKVGSGRPYDEMGNIVDRDRFGRVPRASLQPMADPEGGPDREHPELAWQDGPGPTYSRETAVEMLGNRYEQLIGIMRRTLPRLRESPAFLAVVTELRQVGWLDWHLLTAVYNIALQSRLAHAGLNTREALERPGAEKATRELLFSPENSDEPEVPLAAFSVSGMRWGLQQSIPSTIANWDLHPRSHYADYPALRRLLVARYGYETDDIEHDDPFALSGTATTADGG